MLSGLPPIDVTDLKVLVALADARHFAKAAEACHLSQPALSARIRRMEQALQTPLVERGRRFLGFTVAGERVLARARQMLADLHGLVQDAHTPDRLSGRLRLGVIPTATPLAGRLAALLDAAQPEIRFEVYSLSSRQIERGLIDFTLEAGLTYLDDEPVAEARTLPLLVERYCLVGMPAEIGPADIPLTWSEIGDRRLGLLTRDMQNRRIVDRALTAAGLAPPVAFESNSVLALLSRARAGGLGVILPRLVVDAAGLEGLAARNLSDGNRPQIGLVAPRRDPLLPLTAALWSCATTLAAAEGLGFDPSG